MNRETRFHFIATIALVGSIVSCARVDSRPIQAAVGIREHFFDREYSAGYAAGKIVMQQFPDDDSIVAWFAGNAARAGHLGEAVTVAEARIARNPSSGWAHFAMAAALFYDDRRKPECLEAAAAAYELDPQRADFIWGYAEALRLQVKFEATAALFEKHRALVEQNSNLLVVRGSTYYDQYARSSKKIELKTAAYEDFRAAERLDPTNTYAYFAHAFFLSAEGANDEAFDRWQAAVSHSSASSVRAAYWGAALKRSTVDPAESKKLVRADVEQFVQSRPRDPDALFSAAGAMQMLGDDKRYQDLQDQILALNIPGRALDQTKSASFMNRAFKIVSRKPDEPATPEAARQLESEIIDFLASPGLEPDTALMTTQWLVMLIDQSPEPSPRAIETLTRLFLKQGDAEPWLAYLSLPKILADKGIALDDAERILLEGKTWFGARVADAKEESERQIASEALYTIEETLGWVWFKQGKLEAAERQLALAAKNPPATSPVVFSHLASLYLATKQMDTAMLYLERCLAAQWNQPSPCAENLTKYYRQRFGKTEGEEAWVASKTKELQSGKAAALNERYQRSTKKLKPFELATLDGRKIKSAELRGKILVVSFWGAWCGACMVELPELQAFATRNEEVGDVLFLTINNDRNANDARKAAAEMKVSFQVALDDGYAAGAGVYSFPTTWIIGPTQDRRLELRGLTPNLSHELEAMVAAVRGK